MQTFQTLDLPIQAISLDNLSNTSSKIIAIISTLLIFILISWSLFQLQHTFTDPAGYVMLTLIALSVIGYVKDKKNYPLQFMNWLADQTPVGILAKKDKQAFEQSKQVLLPVVGELDLMQAINQLADINPELKLPEYLEIARQQKKGDLETWVNTRLARYYRLTLLIEKLNQAEQIQLKNAPF